jgi:hypothetical protein
MWRCKDCKKRKRLTRHSLTGSHQKPFIMLCRECHNKRHGNVKQKVKYNKKVQRGTPYKKYKKQ